MQRYAVYLYLETSLHISGGISTHHQVWQIPDAVDTVVCAPDDECKYQPKYVEQFPDINKLRNVASCWIYIGILLGAHPILHLSKIRVNTIKWSSLLPPPKKFCLLIKNTKCKCCFDFIFKIAQRIQIHSVRKLQSCVLTIRTLGAVLIARFVTLRSEFDVRPICMFIRNASGENYRENENTHFIFNVSFFFKSCRL
jgi:hypothetical protein